MVQKYIKVKDRTSNEKILCSCGCGSLIWKYSKFGCIQDVKQYHHYKKKLYQNKICSCCSKEFEVTSKHPNVRFCSRLCVTKLRKGKSYEEQYGIERANQIKNKWHYVVSDERKKEIGNFFRGKSYEEISGEEFGKVRKQKASERNIGEGNPFFGRKHNEESKLKQSLQKLGKSHEEIMGNEKALKWKERMSGKNSPAWNGGTSNKDYKNFTDRFKKIIRTRDNQICMMCGKHREKLNLPLSVHHIDYDRYNSILSNCVSLCFECHPKTNFNRKYWIEFFHSMLKDKYNYDYSNKIIEVISIKNEQTY